MLTFQRNATVFLDPQLILTGIGIGLLISAPIGPVNVLAMQRTLERWYWGGVAAGLGAVFADGLIAAIAAFGITAISGAMTDHRFEVQLWEALSSSYLESSYFLPNQY